MIISESIHAPTRFLVSLIFSKIADAKIINTVDGAYIYLAMFAHPPTQKSLPASPRVIRDVKSQNTTAIETSRRFSFLLFDLKEEKVRIVASSIGDVKNIPTGEKRDPIRPSTLSQVPLAAEYSV